MKRIAMISVHECPLASSEGKEKGGINVYVFEFSKALSKIGYSIDIFTRAQDTVNPRIVHINEKTRVIHLPAGPLTKYPKKEVIQHLSEFANNMHEFIRERTPTLRPHPCTLLLFRYRGSHTTKYPQN